MTPPEQAVEAALANCEQLARKLRRSPHQVRAAASRAEVQKAARAWFASQRGLLAPLLGAEVRTADRLNQDLLEATGRATTRAAYLGLLAELRGVLLRYRSHPAVLGAATGFAAPLDTERAPSFAALAVDAQMQISLSRRWQECETCLQAGAPLAAAVMMGGVLEGVLFARCEHMVDKEPLYRAHAAPRKAGQTLPLQDWPLGGFIAVAHEMGWISPVLKGTAGVIQDFRNFVHPAKERRAGPAPTLDDAGILWEITKRIVRQVLGA